LPPDRPRNPNGEQFLRRSTLTNCTGVSAPRPTCHGKIDSWSMSVRCITVREDTTTTALLPVHGIHLVLHDAAIFSHSDQLHNLKAIFEINSAFRILGGILFPQQLCISGCAAIQRRQRSCGSPDNRTTAVGHGQPLPICDYFTETHPFYPTIMATSPFHRLTYRCDHPHSQFVTKLRLYGAVGVARRRPTRVGFSYPASNPPTITLVARGDRRWVWRRERQRRHQSVRRAPVSGGTSGPAAPAAAAPKRPGGAGTGRHQRVRRRGQRRHQRVQWWQQRGSLPRGQVASVSAGAIRRSSAFAKKLVGTLADRVFHPARNPSPNRRSRTSRRWLTSVLGLAQLALKFVLMALPRARAAASPPQSAQPAKPSLATARLRARRTSRSISAPKQEAPCFFQVRFLFVQKRKTSMMRSFFK